MGRKLQSGCIACGTYEAVISGWEMFTSGRAVDAAGIVPDTDRLIISPPASTPQKIFRVG
jgi:hypothetical protein